MDMKSLLQNRHWVLLSCMFILLLVLLVISRTYRGGVMLLSIILFGILSSVYKEKELKISSLAYLVILSLVNLFLYGVNLGIEFKGGVRLPITLEKAVSTEDMAEIIQKIRNRISTLGLVQVLVYAVGNDQIFVELPEAEDINISMIKKTITQQGVYEAVVDGRVVLRGSDIIPETISPLPRKFLGGADWGVSFMITREAAERFAKEVLGKGNYPLHMFLDRPKKSVVVLNKEKLLSMTPDISEEDVLVALDNLLSSEGWNITLVFEDELENLDLSQFSNDTLIIVERGSNYTHLFKSFPIKEVSEEELYPKVVMGRLFPYVDEWKALGLLSSPVLSPDITQGRVSVQYSITGKVRPGTTPQEEEKFIMSILKGGSFDVKLYVGSETKIPAPLGNLFFQYSLIALVVSLVVISLFIALRYKHVGLFLPIILVTLAELVVLVSTIGSFTLDMSAMAGIIAAIGVSIDAQIIITDEILSEFENIQEALKRAFEIIRNNVTVAVLAMLPLFFSSLIEIVGFATVAIIGGLLGLLISRPSYAVLLEELKVIKR